MALSSVAARSASTTCFFSEFLEKRPCSNHFDFHNISFNNLLLVRFCLFRPKSNRSPIGLMHFRCHAKSKFWKTFELSMVTDAYVAESPQRRKLKFPSATNLPICMERRERNPHQFFMPGHKISAHRSPKVPAAPRVMHQFETPQIESFPSETVGKAVAIPNSKRV